MKRKEKEHLKADPFVHFFEQSVNFFKNNRRLLLIGAGIALFLVAVMLALFFFNNLSTEGENDLYASAFSIRSNSGLSIDQRIAKLQELKFKKGISSVGPLFIAALYYEKGDLANAEKTLQQYNGSRVAIVSDQKRMLEAQLLAAGGKSREGMDLLKRMLDDKDTVMGKELIILVLAKMQTKNQLREEAVASLKRIVNEYANTPSAQEAQTLLAAGETVD